MIRSILVASALVFVAVVARPVQANPPTPAQIEQAKKAFAEGKKLYDAKKYDEAVLKFKESYKLSQNPVLLYNIATAHDEAKEEDVALLYFRRFLREAPNANEDLRALATSRVAELEKKLAPNPGTVETTPSEPVKPEPARPDPGPRPPVVIKPPGTYSATDFEHQAVEVAPPGKPLDITAYVPEDSGFVVTLYFRTAGEGKFTSKVMKWRYKELVGRVPAPKMIGNALQYYIEVKDAAGAVVTRSGKSTSPNLVNIEAGAPQRFYPDFNEDGEVKTTTADVVARDDEDDPFGNKKPKAKQPDDDDTSIEIQPQVPGDGFADVGSQKFKYAKWGTTAGAATLLGLSVFAHLTASRYARSLEEESTRCGAPPCAPFDEYNQDLEASGKSYQTMSRWTLGLGVAAGVVAGYFWYKELTAKKRGGSRTAAKASESEGQTSWSVVPALDTRDGFFGGAAAWKRF